MMFQITIGVIGCLVAGGFGVVAYGASLPASVTASRSAVIPAPVDVVFGLVSDVGAQADWRSDVGSVQLETGGQRWVEVSRAGVEIAFEEIARVEGERYEIRFSSPQGFRGQWTGVFQASGETTTVTFTETVETPRWIGRVIGRMFAPPGGHIDRYLGDLDRAARDRAGGRA